MENQNQNNQPQEQTQPQGWKDVTINADMPLVAIVHFLNVLNQRLCNIEDNLIIKHPTGDEFTLTEVYKQQAELEQEMLRQQESENIENTNSETQGE